MPVSFLRRCLATAAVVSVAMAALPGPAMAAVGLTQVASGFSAPIFLTHAGDSRLFVVEQDGKVKIIDGVGVGAHGTFLDITGMTSKGGEQGLLGLAFHPNYTINGLFYVNYTRRSDGDTVIAEFKRSSDPKKADPASKRVVMIINQPYDNHNGGWIGFKGSYLYIAMGDGGAGGDPGNRAQNLNSLLGKILRINPLDPPGSARYSIPGDNPFVGIAGKDQIWSYGLRNPWRCSFDRDNGTLYCGDVGQETYEEIDRAPTGRGVNFGWRLLEGEHYYDSPGHTSGALCTVDCKTLPIAEYSHGSFDGGNCSVTGGYVSRRQVSAPLYGQYIFGDFCSGKVWKISGSTLTLLDDTPYNISSFGEGNDGRLYLVHRGGTIYRLDDS